MPVNARDVLVFAAATAAALVIFIVAREGGRTEPDILGAGLLVLAGAPLLVQRRWPVAAFGAVIAVVMVYLSLDYAGGTELPLILAGLYGVSSAGRRWWTAVLAGLFAGGGSVYRLFVEGDDPLNVTVGAALLLLTALLGDSVHARRVLRRETQERLRAADAEKESLARALVAEERLRIAHELHDVMAHTITTMSVQAGAVADLVEHRPDRVREPVAAMRKSAREAMLELRAIIRLLRESDQEVGRAPQPRLDQLDDLVAGVEDTGLDVDLVIEGAPERKPSAALDLTAYRIIQEALTNVIRHADASHVQVRLAYEPTRLHVKIADDGRGANGQPSDGHGLRGLRERTNAVGGSLDAGPRREGGFLVEASLPLEAGP